MLPYIQTQNFVKHKENELRHRADNHRLWQLSREKYRMASFRYYNRMMSQFGRIFMLWRYDMRQYYKERPGESNPLLEQQKRV